MMKHFIAAMAVMLSLITTQGVLPMVSDASVMELQVAAYRGETESLFEVVEMINAGRVNNDVTLTIRGVPYEEYSIRVNLPGGASRSAGITGQNRVKQADSEGLVSWTWRIGAVTPAGVHEILITREATGERNSLPLVIE